MIRFLVLKYYFTSITPYLSYNQKSQNKIFHLHSILKDYLIHVSTLRLHYRVQINYRKDLCFLTKRFGATHKLSGHLMRKGLSRIWLNFFRLYYIRVLRVNFLSIGRHKDMLYLFKYKDISFFTSVYYFYNSVKDFDRILIWRLFQVNTLFRYTLGIYRKRGKKKCSLKFEFITHKKRIYVAWRWLALFLTLTINSINTPTKLCYSLESFLLQSPSMHPLTLFKLEIYRAKLLQMV